jgi:polyhydroxybutyrate depolymerase
MKISSALVLAMIVALAATASHGRDTPIRDRIKQRIEARKADRNERRDGRVETIKITHDGLEREALVQAPDRGRSAMALVIALHGGTRMADDIFRRTSWPQVARRQGVLLVAPQGVDNQWNDGRGTTISGTKSNADDVGFITKLIATLVKDYGANPRAVFITGVSNGGLMSMRMGCEREGLLAAIAPVISTLPEALVPSCRSASPLPALFMAGTADPLMPYDGEPSAILVSRGQAAPMLSIPETLEIWRVRNGCAENTTRKDLPNINRGDESTVTRIDYQSCSSGAPVVHYRVNGGGHQMPSLKPGGAAIARRLGPLNNDIDGPFEIWRFFERQGGR